jgi:phage pi2 protein 07
MLNDLALLKIALCRAPRLEQSLTASNLGEHFHRDLAQRRSFRISALSDIVVQLFYQLSNLASRLIVFF